MPPSSSSATARRCCCARSPAARAATSSSATHSSISMCRGIPMAIEQRIGRIDRIGQSREVFVFNLVTRGTLEEQVLALLDEKISMFELVVGEVGAILGGLEEERDFSELVLDAWLDATESRRAAAFDALGRRLDASAGAARRRQGAGRDAVRRRLRDGMRGERDGSAARFRRRRAGDRRRGHRAGRSRWPRRPGARSACAPPWGGQNWHGSASGRRYRRAQRQSDLRAIGSTASARCLEIAAAGPSVRSCSPPLSCHRATPTRCSIGSSTCPMRHGAAAARHRLGRAACWWRFAIQPSRTRNAMGSSGSASTKAPALS